MAEQKFQFVGPNNSLINIIAQDREALIAFLKQNVSGKPDVLMNLQRADCKCSIQYPTYEDIPDNDVVCEHGHYMILYVDKQPKNVQDAIMNAGKSQNP